MSVYSIKWCAIACLYTMTVCGMYLTWQRKPTPTPASLYNWEPYSEHSRDAYLEVGHNVLLFVYPVFAVESEYALRRLDGSKIAELFDYEDFAPLMLKHDWSSKEIHNLWRDFGHTKGPFIVVYQPGKQPVSVRP